jgi:TonB family protein
VVQLIPGSIMKNRLQLNCALRSPSLTSVLPASCLVALVVSLTACQKSDLGPTTAERLKSAEQRQQSVPDFYVPRKTVDYMSDLKAIKETAPPVEPPKKDTAAKEATAKEAALKTPPTDAKAVAAKSGNAATTAPASAAAPTLTPAGALGAAPIAATPPSASTPPPKAAEPVATPAPVVVATAAPTSRSTPSQDATPIVSVVVREQPEFPRDAARQGVESGAVRARLTINAAGDVTNVAILQARPLRVFDRSVTNALSRWKFNPGADGRTYDTEVNFQRQ